MADIVFTGGGTAGHCTPNLALIPYLKGVFDEVYYIGSENGIERELAENRGIPYYPIGAVRLIRKFTWKNLAIPWKLCRVVSQAKKILKKLSRGDRRERSRHTRDHARIGLFPRACQ